MVHVAIFGAGGLGGLVHDILLQMAGVEPAALLDSDPARRGATIDGLRVAGGLEAVDGLRWRGITHAVVAIGDNAARIRIATLLQGKGLELASAIHPLTSIARSAVLGAHLIAGARTTICTHARVEHHCVLSTGSIVEHDNRIQRGAFLHPAVRLAGGVSVGRRATLGLGACVIPYRTIGADARIEPGSVVIHDVPDGANVGGVPARPRGRRETLSTIEPIAQRV
jgi:UDP-perosamine 4-acetyltransferase